MDPTTINLSDKAILVHLRVCRWAGTKQDPTVTEEVCENKEAAKDAGVWVTYFIPPGKLKDLKSKANHVRSVWMKHSRPWLDGGVRILRTAFADQFMTEIKEAIAQYDAEAKRWLEQDYPVILAEMPDRLKKLLDGRTMPTAEELSQKFRIELNLMPLPNATQDWRGQMSDDEISKQMRESQKRMLTTMEQDLWRELGLLVKRVQERLSDPGKKFKDSLIANLRTFCETLPSWNLTEDAVLEQTRKSILEQIGSVDPQDLRENDNIRQGVAKKAASALESLKTRKIDLDL